MDITCISDLHGHYPELEGGDLLIVAGDLTARDEIKEYSVFLRWFVQQEYKKKILIGGNHDNKLMGQWPGNTKGPFREDKAFYDFDYLCDSSTEFEYEEPIRYLLVPNDGSIVYKKKLKIWGSPWTKTFPGMNPKCKAFTVDTDEELAEKWALIPDDTEILITHCPPYEVMDEIDKGKSVGSKSLAKRVLELKNLKLHVFGHVHEGYGELNENPSPVHFVNASHVNEFYHPVNKPIRVVL